MRSILDGTSAKSCIHCNRPQLVDVLDRYANNKEDSLAEKCVVECEQQEMPSQEGAGQREEIDVIDRGASWPMIFRKDGS